MKFFIKTDEHGNIVQAIQAVPALIPNPDFLELDTPDDFDIKDYYIANQTLVKYTDAERNLKNTRKPHLTWSAIVKDWIDLRDLNLRKISKVGDFKLLMTKEMNSNITIANNVIQADENSRAALLEAVQQAVAAKQDNEPFSIKWTLADNSEITVNANQLIAVYKAIRNRTQQLRDKFQAKRVLILAATDEAELNAINWED